MRKRCRIAHHTFDIRFHHRSKRVSGFGGSTIFVYCSNERLYYYFFPVICPGDPPENGTDCKCNCMERLIPKTFFGL